MSIDEADRAFLQDVRRQVCTHQLACLTACAKALSDPADELLSLEGLTEATDESAKAKTIQSDLRVEQLRAHLLAAIPAITQTFARDAEIAQDLSDFLKACTSTHLATPLSLDTLPLLDVLATVIRAEPSATWFSVAAVLLFRTGKRVPTDPEAGLLQHVFMQSLGAGIETLQHPGGRFSFVQKPLLCARG